MLVEKIDEMSTLMLSDLVIVLSSLTFLLRLGESNSLVNETVYSATLRFYIQSICI